MHAVAPHGQVPGSHGTSRRRAQQQEPADNCSETSDEADFSDVDADDGLAARLWDDLVDMERFWPHAVLAAAELAGGTLLLGAIATCLGAPTLRCGQVNHGAATMMQHAWYSMHGTATRIHHAWYSMHDAAFVVQQP